MSRKTIIMDKQVNIDKLPKARFNIRDNEYGDLFISNSRNEKIKD